MSLVFSEKRPFGGVFLFRQHFWWRVGGGLMALAWLDASHYAPWLNFQAEASTLAGLAVCSLALAARRSRVEIPGPVLAPLVCSAVVLAQWATGLILFGGDVFIALLFLFALAAAVALGYQLAPSSPGDAGATHGAPPHGLWLWAPALASAMVGLLQWLGYSDALGVFGAQTPSGFRAIGNMAQPNQLATLLLLGACAAWYDHERGRLGPAPAMLLVSFLGLVLVLSQSRTALLSAAALAVFVAVKLRHRDRRWHTPWWVPLAWAVMIGVLYALAPWVYAALLLGSDRSTPLASLNLRDVIWQQLAHALAMSPWWGWGWNQTSVAQHAAAHWHPGAISYAYAHNIVIDLLVWCGIPLGAALTALCGWWCVARATRARTLTGVAAFAGLIPILVHSLLEFPFAYAFFLVTAGVLVGMVERDADSQRPSWTSLLRRQTWIALVALASLAGVWAAVEYLRAEEDFRVARFSAMRVGSAPAGHQKPTLVLLTQLDALLRATRTEPRRDMDTHTIALLRDVALRFSYPAIDYRYARALALNGDIEGAIRQFETIRSVYGEADQRVLLSDLKEKSQEFPEFLAVVAAFQRRGG